jgi:hypothetical protein
MILHCVFCNFRKEISLEQRVEILQDLSTFSKSIEGVLAFDYGPNRDFERESQNYSDGFVIRFESQAALKAYAHHSIHQDLGGRLCDLCTGGGDGVIVFDVEVSDLRYQGQP